MKRLVIGLGAAALSVVLASATIAQAPDPAPIVVPTAEQMAAGQQAFENGSGRGGSGVPCATCHLTTGMGGVGVQLVGNPVIALSGSVIETIIEGVEHHGMPSFAHLSNETIASIVTYIRNSWGHAYGLVTPAEVAAVRAEMGPIEE